MRFLIDAQLPPALAHWIGQQGQSASAARDAGLRDSDDGSIYNFARAGEWVVITKDEDFIDRCLGEHDAPQVVWLRIGNCTNPRLYEWLEPLWPSIVGKLESGDRMIEVRRPA